MPFASDLFGSNDRVKRKHALTAPCGAESTIAATDIKENKSVPANSTCADFDLSCFSQKSETGEKKDTARRVIDPESSSKPEKQASQRYGDIISCHQQYNRQKTNTATKATCKECLIPVSIHGREVIALVDSGATHSMIGKTLLSQVPSLENDLQQLNPEIIATAVNGSTVNYTGSLYLVVNIQGDEYPVYSLYSSDISYDIILGFDFLKQNGLIIDFTSMAVNTQRSCSVKLPEKVILNPGTDTLLWGTPDTDIMFGTGFVTNNTELSNRVLFVANAVVSVTPYQKCLPVRVLNPTLHEKILEEGTVIANLCLLSSENAILESNDDIDIENVDLEADEKEGNNPTANTSNEHGPVSDEFKQLFDLEKSTFTPQQKELLYEKAMINRIKGC